MMNVINGSSFYPPSWFGEDGCDEAYIPGVPNPEMREGIKQSTRGAGMGPCWLLAMRSGPVENNILEWINRGVRWLCSNNAGLGKEGGWEAVFHEEPLLPLLFAPHISSQSQRRRHHFPCCDPNALKGREVEWKRKANAIYRYCPFLSFLSGFFPV